MLGQLARTLALCAGAAAIGCGSGSTPSGGPPTPQDLCMRFISCAYQAQPDAAAGAAQSYGSDGACWKTESADVCAQGCTSGLKGLHALHPDASECALCKSDAECGGATPACDAGKGECVACETDAHCTAPGVPACDVATHTCVACAADAQCTAAGAPACDVTTHACVACVTDAHCTDPAAPACDVTHHVCVECTQGSECASKQCKANHTCCQPATQCGTIYCGAVSDGCGGTLTCSCPSGAACESGFCVPTCTPGTNGACTNCQGSGCTGVCVLSIDQSTHICVPNAFQSGANGQFDCNAGLLYNADTTKSECGAACRTDQDCPSGLGGFFSCAGKPAGCGATCSTSICQY